MANEDELRTELLERIEKVETTLLKEFRKWAVRIEAAARTSGANQIGFEERLHVLETRVDDLESK